MTTIEMREMQVPNTDTIVYGVYLIGEDGEENLLFSCATEFLASVYISCWKTYNNYDDKIVLKNDPVNHPSHYTSHPSGVECIAITRHMNFNLGNALKYIWRADLKHDAIEDLEKAVWYLQDEIAKRNNHAKT